ncbi:ArsC/Spx/MgsR family protein [Reichenbachiella sp. MALMAid0571]|uniref:ArsC/Spx/MgsR family protein n=1 Tax=Reichenbachiella sp. MALMAid0571 TaxID=3143939 RepID=UPI0032DF7DC1
MTTISKMTIVYNGEDNFSKETLAYMNILSSHIKKYDTSKVSLSISFIKDLLLRLKMDSKDLIIAESSFMDRFKSQIDHFKEEDYIKLFHKYPQLLKTPIVLTESKAYIITNKADIFNLQSLT